MTTSMAAAGLLAGRLALVTGGGSGIGRAVCQVFAREGARVAVVDQNEAGAQETLQQLQTGDHAAFGADVSSSSSIQDLMTSVQNQFSSVPTVTVNSAGIVRDALLIKMNEAMFDQVINVNLKGTFVVTQAVSKLLIENKINNASIVNISSIVAKMGNIGQVNYAASKAGVLGVTKTAALELGRYGIRVNAILPGFIETPMTAGLPEKVTKQLCQMIALGRTGQPSEVAEVCLFLASDRSSYMTGASIDVAGGMAL